MMSAASQNKVRIRIVVALLILMLLAVGFWLRARHLGDLGLVVDEGFQALAVRGILIHGVPKVDSGLIYARSIPFLYTQALAAKLFGLSEFSLRFPSVLFGVAAIVAAYVLAVTLFSRKVGLLTATIMTFSVWEIEMSRYGRFYTAFQFMYVVSLLCFYRGFMVGQWIYKLWFIVAALITYSLHPLGVVLVTCFLIPLFSISYSTRRKLLLGLWAGGLTGVWVLYHKMIGLLHAIDAPHFYSQGEASAMGILKTIRSIIGEQLGIPPFFYIPRVRFLRYVATQDPLWLLGPALVSGVATAYLLYRFFRRNDGRHTLVAIPMVWTAFLHQFGLVLLMLAVYAVSFARDLRWFLDPALRVVYGVVAFCLAFWIWVAADLGLSANRTLKAILGYPDFYSYFLMWFVKGWPILTIFFGLGSLLLLVRFLSDRSAQTPLFALGAVFIPSILVSFSRPHYMEARYTFHLYPLMVIVFAMIATEAGSCLSKCVPLRAQLSRIVVAAAMVLGALFISQDANPGDAWSIGNRTYQSARDPIRSVINWQPYAGFHQDHKSPSLYVRERLAPGDRVVALGPPHMVAVYYFYIGRVDYAVGGPIDFRYHRTAKDGKIVTYITASEILDSLPEVKQIIEVGSGGGIWLLGDRMLLVDDNSVYSRSMKEYLKSLAIAPDYLGIDGQTFAVKVR
jgi:4-amino-4-deoxy-L-arabinose transferase-like glycosyltransferase